MSLDFQIYLASASPRRRELLRRIGIVFEVMPSNILEERARGESPEQYVVRAALDKARYVAGLVRARGLPARPVLGADTEVVLDGEILGKPRDRTHGIAMLRRLAARAHDVLSAVALVHDGKEHTALSRSRVTFGPMSDAEIAAYWDSGEPADKAGAYGVQGHGARYIARLEGSYSGVVGLPLYELMQLFQQAGIEP